jgi:hypothetical protein
MLYFYQMIKSQFIILGILSLIAVVGTTTTLSHAFALTQSDVLALADKASKGSLSQSDIGGFIDQAKPNLGSQALKDFADKAATGQVSQDDISGLVNSTSAK